MSFFGELKRRNVFKVGVSYVVTAWILLQVVDIVLENITAPDWIMHVFMLALALGLPFSAQTIIQAFALWFGIAIYSLRWTRLRNLFVPTKEEK